MANIQLTKLQALSEGKVIQEAESTGNTYMTRKQWERAVLKAYPGISIMNSHIGNHKVSARDENDKLVAWYDSDTSSFIKASKEVKEAKNHMGETEYNTWSGWRAACKKVNPDYKIEGDKDIAEAKVDGKSIGQWDGEKGTIYDDAHKAKKAKVEEAKAGWSLIKGEKQNQLVRFSGKTFPVILLDLEDNKIYARNDNGSAVSKTLSTSDLSVEGIRKIISGFSTPEPSDTNLEALLKSGTKKVEEQVSEQVDESLNLMRKLAGLPALIESSSLKVSIVYVEAEQDGVGDAHIKVDGATSISQAIDAISSSAKKLNASSEMKSHGLTIATGKKVGDKKSADGWTVFYVWE